MKGETEMTFNPSYAELLGRELQRQRRREADRERLIREAAGWNPSPLSKSLLILRSRWSRFWSRIIRKKVYIPLSPNPKNSLS